MKPETTLEYMCPYCGAFNDFSEHTIRDMYQEQVETCGCCKKNLSLIAANGVEGRINLIISELETEFHSK
ncbi:conserved hypothetical protein [Alteromonas sp. 38]|uniref:hypothetical protein n=1 Tax=Alteromonas TaxID=226 RepID=UPI0012F306D7|nr:MULTISPECIES: hypothetical protein [Alteromonas]CAD5249465.1 conserved hypothetical protein [Alteromonas sp. 154]VXC45439.1 conserved hypothetical protein [Alteromonas sp. 38]